MVKLVHLYIYDWNEGKIVDNNKLKYDYPCKLTLRQFQ